MVPIGALSTGPNDRPSRRRRRSTPRPAVLVLVALGLAAPLILPGSASATPQEEVQAVAQRIERLRDQAERASEEYNATRERISGLQVRITAARTRAKQQQARVEAARTALGVLAAETYKDGGLSTLELVLGDDPDVALALSGTLTTLTERRAGAVETLRREQARLSADVRDVERQQLRLASERAALGALRARVLATLATTQAELADLQEEELASLVRASRSGERAALSRALGRPVGAKERVTCEDVGVNPPDARVAKVLDYACDHLGDRYVFGAAGPSTFDCSGLSQQAWARAGVSLPHNAAMQSRLGTRVAAADLRPGDLVFYNRPISHMGIYLGSGLMVHAPHTGDVVRVAPVRYGKLTAAVRL